MKLGPLTFQWACLVCVCRSMQSARRAISSSTALTRAASERPFFVLNMVGLQVEGISSIRQRWAMWWTCNPPSGHSVTGMVELDLAAEHPVDRCRIGQDERQPQSGDDRHDLQGR